MKEETNISLRQLMAILFPALITVGLETLSGLTVAKAGAAAWLAPLAVLVLLVVFAQFGFRKNSKTGQAKTVLETVPGRIIAVIPFLWGLYLLAVNSARCGQRLAVSGGSALFYSSIILLAAVWMAAGKLPAFARTCEIFYFVLVVALALIVIFAFFRLEPGYVLLISRAEWKGLPAAGLSVLGVVSQGVYALSFAKEVTPRKGDRARCTRWIIGIMGTLSLGIVMILGRFGGALTQRMERPFFQMVAGVGFTGAFQRLESLVSALWVLGDLALLGLLLTAEKRLLTAIFNKKLPEAPVCLGMGLIALIGGAVLAARIGGISFSWKVAVPYGSLAAAVLLWVLAGLKTGAKREKNAREKKV